MTETAAAQPRRRARARAGAAVAALGGGGLTIAYLAYALLAPVPAVAASLQPPAGFSTPAAEVALPGYGASAIGSVADERIFAGSDLDTPRPIASITKVVTALVVLDAHPIAAGQPGATLTLTAADAALRGRYAAIGGTTAPAPPGLAISERQVIELMMVQSANNYAESLAIWAFGSMDAYLAAARAWLDARGLMTIRIADATGFSPSNTASPRALLDLGRLALADPVVSAASALPSVTVPGVGTFENRNLLIGVDGVTGLKTGTLDEAGACLLFTAVYEIEGETVPIVGVVLGGPDHRRLAADVRSLLASVRDDFHAVTIATAGELVALYAAPWGETARVEVTRTVDELVWGAVNSRAAVALPALRPGLESPPLDTLTVRFGGRVVEVDVTLTDPLEGPDLAWRLSRPLVDLLGG
ncbi:MAG: serine hydrolase [Microbacteriaceae bacterium]|nr:serine hydrolase [Microbacteriaceae bacterium]